MWLLQSLPADVIPIIYRNGNGIFIGEKLPSELGISRTAESEAVPGAENVDATVVAGLAGCCFPRWIESCKAS